MSITILTANGVNNTNIDGARNYNFNAGNRSGIVKGAFNEGTFFATSNIITLDTCELRLSGHRIIIDEAIAISLTQYDAPATETRYSMVAEISVNNSSIPTFRTFLQASSTELIKNNLFQTSSGEGTYQLEIGRFTLTPSLIIKDVIRTADLITGGTDDENTYINIGDVTTTITDAGTDAEVDIENETEDGITKTNFNFSLPLNGIGNNIIKLYNSSGTLTDEQYTNLITNNYMIFYDNSIYIKTYSETSNDITTYYFYSNKETNTTSSGSQVITKYYISINSSTKAYTYTTAEFFNTYNKSQLDTLFGGKQNTLTAGTNITINDNTISATDTTYENKTASQGGTDVSLVTTGDKFKWNTKSTVSAGDSGSSTTRAKYITIDGTEYLIDSSSIAKLQSLPTATADSPDFVNIVGGTNDGKLYRKKASQYWDETTLAGMTWQLNNTSYYSSSTYSSFSYNINFKSNGSTFNSFRMDNFNPGVSYYNNVYYGNTKVNGAFGSSVGWLNQNYRTIEITGGNDVTNSSLIAWLKTYADIIEYASETYEYIELQDKITSTNKLDANLIQTDTTHQFITDAEKSTYASKSTVSVSNAGTSQTQANYITINGTEYQIGGSGGGGGSGITNYEVIDNKQPIVTQASATSPDFIQINGQVYYKKVTENITSLAGSTWIFNDDLGDLPTEQFNINFSSNSSNYDGIRITTSTMIYGVSSFDTVYSQDAWQNNSYKTISIVDGTDVADSDFIAWLKTNAVRISGGTVSISYEYAKVSAGGSSGGSDNYSETETVIGTWIDGKPLYRKVVVFNNITVGNNPISHGISNINTVVNCRGVMKSTNSSDAFYPNTILPTDIVGITRVTSTTINFWNKNDYYGPQTYRTWYFTLEYTKTTD